MKNLCTLAAFVATSGFASAVNLFTPGDFTIGIGEVGSQSGYPGGENPNFAIDGNTGNKYLNFGEENSGFIVTPNSGASTVTSLDFWTANDAPERDPASFSLYGTNSAIASGDNSLGNLESWTLITSSAVALPAARNTGPTSVSFANVNAFTSYRLLFDTVVDAGLANSMQIAEVGFNGAGGAILGVGETALAVDTDMVNTSGYPGAESPAQAIDGDVNTKYLNTGGSNTGLIVTPSVGASIADSFTLTTANDAPDRDPVDYSVFGTNDAITSADNSDGSNENWVLIQSGTLTPPGAFFTDYATETLAGNTTAYTSYRFDIDANAGGGLMQFSELQFDGTVVPEPSSGLLALLGAGFMALRRRRK